MAQTLQFKWSGKDIEVTAEPSETIEQLKHKLEQATFVSAKRQKILGLKTKDGKMASDAALVGDLAIKPGTKIMMMGCVALRAGSSWPRALLPPCFFWRRALHASAGSGWVCAEALCPGPPRGHAACSHARHNLSAPQHA